MYKRQVIHKKNGGLSDARNVGLDIAQGEYVAFVDSDDFVDEDYIYKLYNALQQNRTSIAVCGIQIIDELSLIHISIKSNRCTFCFFCNLSHCHSINTHRT